MNSSTLRSNSKSRPGQAAVVIVLAAALSWIAAAVYTVSLNPQIRSTVAICRAKLNWSQKLRGNFPNQTIICGGSSSSFSIDPGWALEKYKRPISNLAISADMGALTLVRFALQQARPGDTLVLAFEPTLLGGKIEPLLFGMQFAFAMKDPQWANDSLNLAQQRVPWTSAISALRPGGRHVFTLLAKIAARRPLDRYGLEPVLETGQAQTSVRLDSDPPSQFPAGVSAEGRLLLETVSSYCKERKIRVAYLLPWQYATPAVAPKLAQANRAFLKEVRELVPVIQEPQDGVIMNRAAMSDTIWHLNREAARDRTESLVRALDHFEQTP